MSWTAASPCCARSAVQSRVVSGNAQGVIKQGRAKIRGLWKACLSQNVELALASWTLVSHADGLFSAAVLGRSALAGEALSRGLLYLGVQRGLDLLRRWPELQALMVKATGTVHAGYGLALWRSAAVQALGWDSA